MEVRTQGALAPALATLLARIVCADTIAVGGHIPRLLRIGTIAALLDTAVDCIAACR